MGHPVSWRVGRPHIQCALFTECVNSSVARFARKVLSKFLRPMSYTTAAVQSRKKKIACGTLEQTLRPSHCRTLYATVATCKPPTANREKWRRAFQIYKIAWLHGGLSNEVRQIIFKLFT